MHSRSTGPDASNSSAACTPSPSGTTDPAAVLRARPAGREAFLLLLGRSPVRLRFRNQGVVRASGISPALDDDVLPEVLAFGYTSGERALFRGIRKLMPGHRLTLNFDARRSPGSTSSSIGTLSRSTAPMDTDWIVETRHRLEESVRMRLMSDVPLGMFLSGGIDSTAIAAIIKRSTSAR